MKLNCLSGVLCVAAALLLSATPACFAASHAGASAPKTSRSVETIVMIRHGEKPAGGLGQLDCKGLNRALALPSVLLGRWGTPDYIFAPDPIVKVHDNAGMFFYVRPLVTIEPTAIRAGRPVNTAIGFDDLNGLQRALTDPRYAHSLIFVAWEHVNLHTFAAQFLKAYGGNPSILPPWPNSDYDTIYVFTLIRKNGTPQLKFRLEHEGLNNRIGSACPAPLAH